MAPSTAATQGATPKPRDYWSTCHSTHDKIKPACSQLRNRNHTCEARHRTQPPQRSEQYSWWCAGFCLPTTWSPLKSFLFLFSSWDVVCPCIHWVVQNTKQHPFLIHAGSVCTICVFLAVISMLLVQCWCAGKFPLTCCAGGSAISIMLSGAVVHRRFNCSSLITHKGILALDAAC